MADDDELQSLRRRRLEELQRAQSASEDDAMLQEAVASQQADQERAMREHLMRQILTPDARERLERLRLARADQAKLLENQLISLAQSGRLRGQVSDAQLRSILGQLTTERRDINIRRK